MSHAANAAIDRAFGFEGPRGFKADAAPAPGDATRGPQRDKSYAGTGDMVQELLGTGRPPGSSPPPVKGIQGGKPVTPAPLSKTPDAGQPAKDKPQPNKGKQAPDAGKANDALPPQWLPGALGPKPELMP